jgi:hypothetical protein
MITCDEFLSEFGDYLENGTSAEVREQLELHLSQCRTCHVLYDSTRKTLKIVTESSSFDLPADVSEPIVNRLMTRLRSERGQPH